MNPRRKETVMLCRRTKIPQVGFTIRHEEGISRHFVSESTTNPRLGGVPDVIEIEEQKRATFAGLKSLHCASKAIIPETVKIYSLLIINTHRAVGRNLAIRKVQSGNKRCGREFGSHLSFFQRVVLAWGLNGAKKITYLWSSRVKHWQLWEGRSPPKVLNSG
jgi:hypothetical protein